jgi:hypothetical protein
MGTHLQLLWFCCKTEIHCLFTSNSRPGSEGFEGSPIQKHLMNSEWLIILQTLYETKCIIQSSPRTVVSKSSLQPITISLLID